MKRFTKACLIIALCFTIVGILCCGIGVAAGVSTIDIRNAADRNGLSISGWVNRWVDHTNRWVDHTNRTTYSYSTGDSLSTENVSGDEQQNKGFTASEIKNLEIELKAGAVEFIAGGKQTDIQVYVESAHGDVLVEQVDDTLSIVDNTNIGVFHDYDLVITVEIPDDMKFDDINIDAQAGEVNLSEVNLAANTAELNVDAGHLIAGTMNIEESMDMTVGAGEAELNDITAGDVTLDAGMGHIEYVGALKGDMEADCGVGEIDITLAGDVKDYNYDISCGVGDVEVENHSYTALGDDKSIDNDADNDITLDCGVGQIRVMFQ